MEYILQTNQVSKVLNGKKLVNNIDLHVKKGEIYGFLGRNGAGKTTMMKMITNLWKPTAGNVELFGEVLTPKSYTVLKKIGSIIEFPTFYEYMTGRENLQLHCKYMGFSKYDRIDEVLKLLDITEAAEKPVRSYSLGMKERLGIARAVLCEPELLILDEPTNGLDPAGIKQIRELLKNLCTEQGITIMISSHILSEIESIADTIGIIHQGQMMKEISIQAIEANNQNYLELAVDNEQKTANLLTKMEFSNFKVVENGKFRIYEHEATPQAIARALVLNDIGIISIGKHMETLEDYFLKLTEEVENDD